MPQPPHRPPAIPYRTADPADEPPVLSSIALYIALFFAVGFGLVGLLLLFEALIWLSRKF